MFDGYKLMWGKAGKGRYCKRQLSKARRRYTREMIRGRFWLDGVEPHPRTPLRWESECNWKAT